MAVNLTLDNISKLQDQTKLFSYLLQGFGFCFNTINENSIFAKWDLPLQLTNSIGQHCLSLQETLEQAKDSFPLLKVVTLFNRVSRFASDLFAHNNIFNSALNLTSSLTDTIPNFWNQLLEHLDKSIELDLKSQSATLSSLENWKFSATTLSNGKIVSSVAKLGLSIRSFWSQHSSLSQLPNLKWKARFNYMEAFARLGLDLINFIFAIEKNLQPDLLLALPMGVQIKTALSAIHTVFDVALLTHHVVIKKII